MRILAVLKAHHKHAYFTQMHGDLVGYLLNKLIVLIERSFTVAAHTYIYILQFTAATARFGTGTGSLSIVKI